MMWSYNYNRPNELYHSGRNGMMLSYNHNGYNELYHSGRKGMKWYQHIFTAGREYTRKALYRIKNRKKKNTQPATSTTKTVKKTPTKNYSLSQKPVSQMSNQDISDFLYRKEMENRYAQATMPRKSRIRRYAEYAGDKLAKEAINRSVKVAGRYVEAVGNKKVNELLKNQNKTKQMNK